jgi:hypothetical protein
LPGQPLGTILGHVAVQTAWLLALGVMMVNGTPDGGQMGWSGDAWSALLYASAMLAFASISPPGRPGPNPNRDRRYGILTAILRVTGVASLAFLTFAFRGTDGHRIITLEHLKGAWAQFLDNFLAPRWPRRCPIQRYRRQQLMHECAQRKCSYGGVWAGQRLRGRLTDSRILEILRNPLYAGLCTFRR